MDLFLFAAFYMFLYWVYSVADLNAQQSTINPLWMDVKTIGRWMQTCKSPLVQRGPQINNLFLLSKLWWKPKEFGNLFKF